MAVLGTWPDERVAIASDEYTSKNVGLICYQIVLNQKRKKEKGKRKKEKGERRKEKGEITSFGTVLVLIFNGHFILAGYKQ